MAAGVKSDMRGLVTAGRDFESEWSACLKGERHQLSSNMIAQRSHAGHSQTLAVTTEFSSGQSWGTTHRGWPTTSTSQQVRGRWPRWPLTARFLRTSKPAQRAFKGRLAAWPRARAAGDAVSHRFRSSRPGRYRGRCCQAASTSRRRPLLLPALVTPPWERVAPEEFSVGTTQGKRRSSAR